MIKSTTTTSDPEVSAALSDGPEFSSHQTFPLKYQLLEE